MGSEFTEVTSTKPRGYNILSIFETLDTVQVRVTLPLDSGGLIQDEFLSLLLHEGSGMIASF